MKESEMGYVAELINKAIENRNDERKLEETRNEVFELTKKFPIYNHISYI